MTSSITAVRLLVREFVVKQTSRYIAELANLVALGESGERAIQGYVEDRFRALGGQVEVITYDPRQLTTRYESVDPDIVAPGERCSVVANFPGTGTGCSLLVFAHPDTEPVHAQERWRHPPFQAVQNGDRIHGWGVADDLAGVAAMCCAMETVRSIPVELVGDVVLVSAPSKGHARGIVPVLDRLPPIDAGLYLHPAESGKGLAHIKTATPGILRFLVHITGRPPATLEPDHTPFAVESLNPIDLATSIALAVRRLADHAQLAGLTAQLTYLAAGRQEFLHRVPVAAQAGISVAFPPSVRLAVVRAAVQDTIRDESLKHPWLAQHPPRVRWLIGTEGAAVRETAGFVRLTSAEIAEAAGCAPVCYSLHAASDIRHPILHRGIPTVGLGPRAGDLVQAGGADEWVDVGEYLQTITVTAAVILRWCGAPVIATG
jgi:acetylornithine deacetylase